MNLVIDWEGVEGFLVGECGKSIVQAGFTTAREIRCLFEAKQKEQRERWEIARWQSYLQMRLSPYIKPHHKPSTPQAWIRLPWEGETTENKAKEYRLEQAQIDILELIRQDYYNGKDRRDMGEVRS